MAKKKVKFMDITIKNRSIDEAEKEVMNLFKAVREMGNDKIDVKVSFSTLKEVKPGGLV